MKVIINDTDSISSVVIDGEVFSVEPKGYSKPIEDTIAIKWQKIHGFLSIKDVESVKTVKKEIVEETEEVEVKEVKEGKIKKIK